MRKDDLEIACNAIENALDLLPKAMSSRRAAVLLIAIGLQESELRYRRQQPTGPARGLWQFERGTPRTRGGVTGVVLHQASRFWLHQLCKHYSCPFSAASIYLQLSENDVLAAGVARLLLFTDPGALPTFEKDSWDLYLRCWRPGKPRHETWAGNFQLAVATVEERFSFYQL